MKSKQVKIGSISMGGGAPVCIQSMTNTDTRDVRETVRQIQALTKAGCEVVRISVYDQECVKAVREIKKEIDVPLVADIHFDARLAIGSIEAGIDKLRINPGNIGSKEKVQSVVSAAKEHGVPIRIGVNAGSLEKDLLEKYQGPTAEALVESALGHARILEEENFDQIVISVKHSHVPTMVQAYKLLAAKTCYPLHLGVTESGTAAMGTVKSSVGIGSLLLEGIGDTIRVSLAGDPLQEIPVAKRILKAVGLREEGVEVIACPTCGRTTIEVEEIALEVERQLSDLQVPLKVAVMGCVVNGPGEAKEADIGIAGAAGDAILFQYGQKTGKVEGNDLIAVLVREARRIAEEREKKRL